MRIIRKSIKQNTRINELPGERDEYKDKYDSGTPRITTPGTSFLPSFGQPGSRGHHSLQVPEDADIGSPTLSPSSGYGPGAADEQDAAAEGQSGMPSYSINPYPLLSTNPTFADHFFFYGNDTVESRRINDKIKKHLSGINSLPETNRYRLN